MKYIGVTYQRGSYRARIEVDYRMVSLGSFETARDAAIARDEFVRLYGLDRPLNFGDENEHRQS